MSLSLFLFLGSDEAFSLMGTRSRGKKSQVGNTLVWAGTGAGEEIIRPWWALLAAQSGKGWVLGEKEVGYLGLDHFTKRCRNPRKVRLSLS